MSRSPFANVVRSGRVGQQWNLPVKTQSPPSRSSPPEARWATRSFGVSVWHTGQRCLARAGLRLTASALGPLPEVRVSSPRGAPPAYPGPRACRVGSNEYVQTIPDGVYWTLVLLSGRVRRTRGDREHQRTRLAPHAVHAPGRAAGVVAGGARARVVGHAALQHEDLLVTDVPVARDGGAR